MSTGALPPGPILTATFGPFVTGVMMQQLFLGVFCVQVYDYWVGALLASDQLELTFSPAHLP
jgi:hypothetical protein